MEEIQQKLEKYRLRKRRKEKFENLKNRLSHFLMLGVGNGVKKTEETAIEIIGNCESHKELDGSVRSDSATVSSGEDNISMDDEEEMVPQAELSISSELSADNKWFKYTLWTVYFLFWVTLYIIAIELSFGLVFLLFSALFGIYFNTRTGPKKANEISAYSVFNKNFESIDGTLKAEQFEREMRYGAGSVR